MGWLNYKHISDLTLDVSYFIIAISHRVSYTGVGNFIIRASGSDKQMLCGSLIAHAAPTILAVNKTKKG